MTIRRTTLLKILAAFLWACAAYYVYCWLDRTDVPIRYIPRYIRELIHSTGAWGPVVLIALHIFRTIVFVPTTALILVSGSLYGPVWGTLINLVGANLSAGGAFVLGKFFGRRFVKEHEHGWVRKYDELLTKEGFFTILAMRLLFFPFDVVNYLSGMSGITYRQFALATFLGIIPATVTVTVLGGAFDNPRAYFLFGVLMIATIASVVFMKRSKWVKEKLFAKRPEHVI